MIRFLRIFRSMRRFDKERFEFEESGTTPLGRVYTIFAIERKTQNRVKVCEFSCNQDEKICREKIDRAIRKLNRDT